MTVSVDLRYPAGSLVILTGLPGAGKSTLLARLYGLDGTEREPVVAGQVTVIDSAMSRNRWAALTRLPRQLRRALVFATHVTRIARALSGGRSVLAHNRGNGSLVLRGFAWLARRSGAGFHLLFLDVPAEVAVAGQHERGRVVAPATFDRHRRRLEVLLAASDGTVLTRESADRLRAIHFGPVD
ncbi:ATP-binding protein [Nonomuraea sp. NBC_01738]|uniref:AAA family ATPase n=1 Tax=Nonomuraea sp. NBC_01738 TaxID=2976003 RepID=UPI002E121C3A|nr:ATP-binding protein [Nonomuraea sp. NBC_01738]